MRKWFYIANQQIASRKGKLWRSYEEYWILKLCFTSVKFKIVLYLFYEEKRATIQIRERLFYAFDLRLSLYLSFSFLLSLSLSLTHSLFLFFTHSLRQREDTKQNIKGNYERLSLHLLLTFCPPHTHILSLSYTY